MEHESLTVAQCAARAVITAFGTWSTLDPRTETVVIADDQSGNYLVVLAGWDGDDPVYHPLVHLRVRGTQVVVLHNATDEEIDRLLLQEGVSYHDIILTPEQETVIQQTEREI